MVAIQPGEMCRKNASTSVGGAPLTEIKLLDMVPLMSGQPASATASAPGNSRRWAATCSQKTGACLAPATVSSVSSRAGGKAGGPMRQALEGGNKETGHEMHYKTEGDLSGDQRVHRTAAGMWIVPALQRSDRLHRRGAQRRCEAEQQSDGDSEYQAS